MVEQEKLAFVDALRGMAVLGVIIAHIPLPSPIKSLSIAGAYGVQLFFVVSAFTLFLSLEKKFGAERRPLLSFFIRRFFRIAPAFYLAAAFYLLKDGTGPTFWAPEGIHPVQIASTLLFLHGWWPDTINSIVPGGWSIAVEMTFYLLVPLCFLKIRNAYAALFAAFGLLVAGLIVNRLCFPLLFESFLPEHKTLVDYLAQLWFPAQACVFPLGFALFFMYRAPRPTASSPVLACGLIAITAYLCAALTGGGYSLLPAHFLYGLAFVVLGYALALYPVKVLVNPVMCHIGKVSFSVYLFHFWAVSLAETYLAPMLQRVNPYAAGLALYICVIAMAVAVATVTFALLEKPGQALGRRLIEYINAGPRGAAGTGLSTDQDAAPKLE